MKVLTATLALLLLILSSSYLQAAMARSAFCDSKCKRRCAKAAVDHCFKDCKICCKKCKCVPSGTYGNKDECPCYRDVVTKDGKKRRCP